MNNYSVRNEKFKLIYRGTHKDYLLYDMKNDPYETINIASDTPEIFREMREELDLFMKSFLLFAAEQEGEKPLEVDEETGKRLKVLCHVR